MKKNKNIIPAYVQESIQTILKSTGLTVDDFIRQQPNVKQESAKDSKRWVTRKEAAEIARVSTDTIDNWRQAGYIKSSKTHRARCGRVLIDKKSLEHFLVSLPSNIAEEEVANV